MYKFICLNLFVEVISLKALRKSVCCILSLVLIFLSVFSLNVFASTANLSYIERGVLTDGTNTAYYFIDKDNRVLYITGDGVDYGRTPDYPSADQGPFSGRTDITRIVIEEDVARVGDYVCANIKNADTLEIQSNLLSSNNSMSSKAMIGCTGLRNIQADSSLISTNILLEVIKGAVNIASANWLSLVTNGINVVKTGVSGDGSLDNDTVKAIVNDYITTGEEIYLGEMDTLKEGYQERISCPCYHENAYHHSFIKTVEKSATCTAWGDYRYYCPNCGEWKIKTEIEPLGHNYTSVVFVEPKCTDEGIRKTTCSRCGEITYTSINPTGHLHGHWTVYEMAVPGKRGTLKKVCDECSAVMKTSTLSIPTNTKYTYTTGISLSHNTAADIISSMTKEGYLIYITRNNKALDDDARVGTGTVINTIRPEANITTEVSTAILFGDVNGDGIVDRTDRDMLKSYAFLDGNDIAQGSAYEKAADLNGDGAVDAFDYFLQDGIISGERNFDQSVDYGY